MHVELIEVSPLSECPVCHGALHVRELECRSCDLQMRGHFAGAARFDSLSTDQLRFLETFLACRGIIRDVEAVLSISYPTVKSRLEGVLGQLGLAGGPASAAERKQPAGADRAAVLADLDAGRIDAAAAIAQLNAIKNKS